MCLLLFLLRLLQRRLSCRKRRLPRTSRFTPWHLQPPRLPLRPPKLPRRQFASRLLWRDTRGNQRWWLQRLRSRLPFVGTCLQGCDQFVSGSLRCMGCLYSINRSRKKIKRSAKSGPTPYGDSSTTSRQKSENISVEHSFQLQQSSTSSLFSQRPEGLRVFTYAELKAATNNFSPSLLLGEGGFGCVYRGTIRSSDDHYKKVDVAVKQLSRRGMQGHKEWLTEVHVQGKVEHPNIVKLLGFCAEDDERGMQHLLIYDFMPNRSVLDHLAPQSSTPLSWQMRLRVALDAARGLRYLHEEMSFQIIFRDFKTSNILLDEQWNAKLSDFGFARQGPEDGRSHVSTVVMGTMGYAAPEYLQTGHLTLKSDVWSYGVVLYELITGRHPIDRNRPKNEEKLLKWIQPYISNYHKFPSIVDPYLGQDYHLRSAHQLAAVANKCLNRKPKFRPKMGEVLTLVAEVVNTAATGSPSRSIVAGDLDEANYDKGRGKEEAKCNF